MAPSTHYASIVLAHFHIYSNNTVKEFKSIKKKEKKESRHCVMCQKLSFPFLELKSKKEPL